jgi:hypothetical protein
VHVWKEKKLKNKLLAENIDASTHSFNKYICLDIYSSAWQYIVPWGRKKGKIQSLLTAVSIYRGQHTEISSTHCYRHQRETALCMYGKVCG